MHRLMQTIIVLTVLLFAAASHDADAAGRRWSEGYIPNLEVTNQHGQKLNFYDDVVKNKIVVVNFIYTSCTDICPLSTARMSQVAELLGDRVGRDIFLVSLSVDPIVDTPQKLKAYAETYGAGAGWWFITGSLDNIRAINSRLGEKMRSLTDHRNEVVLGNDRTGEWARNSLFGDINRLSIDILGMDPEWRYQARVQAPHPASDTGYQMSRKPGQAMFKRMCAGCHSIKVGDRVGPDLYGVTQRRSTDWLVKFLQAPDKMRREKDPVSMTLVERFPNVRMPNLGLAEADARDMIAYLKAQTDYLDQQKAEAAQRFSSVSHAHHGGGAAPASHGGDGHGGHGEHSPGMPANHSGHKGHDASGGHAMPSGHQADHHAGHHAAPAPAGSQMQPHGAHMHKH